MAGSARSGADGRHSGGPAGMVPLCILDSGVVQSWCSAMEQSRATVTQPEVKLRCGAHAGRVVGLA
jgi:hypothetical protein